MPDYLFHRSFFLSRVKVEITFRSGVPITGPKESSLFKSWDETDAYLSLATRLQPSSALGFFWCTLSSSGP